MRDARFILLAMALVGPLVFFLLPYAGYPLKFWALVAVAVVAAIYAGVFVLLGETIIEDAVKSGLFLILSGILWYTETRTGFVFISVLAASAIGSLLNMVNRAARD